MILDDPFYLRVGRVCREKTQNGGGVMKSLICLVACAISFYAIFFRGCNSGSMSESEVEKKAVPVINEVIKKNGIEDFECIKVKINKKEDDAYRATAYFNDDAKSKRKCTIMVNKKEIKVLINIR